MRGRIALIVILGVVTLLLAVPAGVALLRPHHPPKLNEENLARSVREDTSWIEAGCVHHQGADWGCNVSRGSDSAVYDVRMTSGHCWEAHQMGRTRVSVRVAATGCL